MKDSRPGCDLLVSLQAPGYELDPVAGHRGEGALARPDLVVAPGMPSSLLEEASTYEVLLIPASGEDRTPERHKISGVEAVGLEGSGEAAVFFRLALPSRLFEPPERTISDSEEFVSALEERDGNLWTLLEDLGSGNPRFRGDITELLQQVRRLLVEAPALRTRIEFVVERPVLFSLWCCPLGCDCSH